MQNSWREISAIPSKIGLWLVAADQALRDVTRFWPIRSQKSQALLTQELLENTGFWLGRTLQGLDCIDKSKAEFTQDSNSRPPEILWEIPLLFDLSPPKNV